MSIGCCEVVSVGDIYDNYCLTTIDRKILCGCITWVALMFLRVSQILSNVVYIPICGENRTLLLGTDIKVHNHHQLL